MRASLKTSSQQHTLVTIAHGEDYGLLRLQARSMRKYVDPNLVAEILVVENFGIGGRVRWRDVLRDEYGGLASKVRFMKASAVASIPITVSGWFAQQILKLMVSFVVPTQYYMILDGKNHLVHPLTADFLIGSSGKPRSYFMNYEHHPMRRYFENTVSYFELDPQKYLRAFVPITTPFVVSTPLVRSLVWHVEERERRRFPNAFLYDGYKRAEFFLIGAYILSKGQQLSDEYEFSGVKNAGIWPESTAEECSALIAANEAEKRPFFAVHRRIFPKLSDRTRLEIAAFWCRHGLFPSERAAIRFLMNPLTPNNAEDS